MKNKILLVDGNLLMFKSFYGTFNPYKVLTNSKGVPTHAIHAFFNTLFKVLEFTDATHCFIAFDASSKTKRHELFQEYKGGRSKAPNELFLQMNYVKTIIEKMNLVWEDKLLFEADDLIATLSQRFKNSEDEIIIFSSDQDLLQLVDENIKIILKDKEQNYFYKDQNNFETFHGILPKQIPDYKGLSGDSSDNLKGVAGIGPKTAINLLNKYSTLENIYQNLDEISKSTRNKLELDKESAFLCKKLAILDFQAPTQHKLETIKLKLNYNPELEQILEELELNVIKTKIKNLTQL